MVFYRQRWRQNRLCFPNHLNQRDHLYPTRRSRHNHLYHKPIPAFLDSNNEPGNRRNFRTAAQNFCTRSPIRGQHVLQLYQFKKLNSNILFCGLSQKMFYFFHFPVDPEVRASASIAIGLLQTWLEEYSCKSSKSPSSDSGLELDVGSSLSSQSDHSYPS